MSLNVESGLRDFRIEWVAETTYGTPPTDPAWAWFSDGVRSFAGNPVRGISPQRWLGDADVGSWTLGSVDSEITMSYALPYVTMLSTPLAGAITRDADQNLSQSLTIVGRIERNLTVGVDSAGSREYIVGVGCYNTGGTMTGSLDPPDPIMINPTYTCKRVRKYRVDQPASATLLGIKSTVAGDTTQTVTVEDEDAGTSQGATLAGTTFTSLGTATYADIEAIWLSAETVGDVEIYENTGTHTAPVAAATPYATIRGQDYYGSDGDRGIPLLGSGSRGSTLGTVYATLANSTIQWNSAALADVVVSEANLTWGNMEGGVLLPTVGTTDKSVIVGGTSYVFSTQVVDTFGTYSNIDDHLGGTEASLTWKPVASALNHTLTLTGALKTNSGGALFEAGQAAPVLSIEISGKNLSIGPTS